MAKRPDFCPRCDIPLQSKVLAAGEAFRWVCPRCDNKPVVMMVKDGIPKQPSIPSSEINAPDNPAVGALHLQAGSNIMWAYTGKGWVQAGTGTVEFLEQVKEPGTTRREAIMAQRKRKAEQHES